MCTNSSDQEAEHLRMSGIQKTQGPGNLLGSWNCFPMSILQLNTSDSSMPHFKLKMTDAVALTTYKKFANITEEPIQEYSLLKISISRRCHMCHQHLFGFKRAKIPTIFKCGS